MSGGTDLGDAVMSVLSPAQSARMMAVSALFALATIPGAFLFFSKKPTKIPGESKAVFGLGVLFGVASVFAGPATATFGGLQFASGGLMAAAVLFTLRTAVPIAYGSLEVAVGSLTLFVVGSIQAAINPVLALIAAGGSIYVVVRGLVNVSDALARAREDG